MALLALFSHIFPILNLYFLYMRQFRTVFFVGITLIMLGVIGYFIYANQKELSEPAATPTPPTISYCSSEDLKASLELSPGAGNIFGTPTLQNISNQTCMILGSGYVNVSYDAATVKNIQVVQMGTPQSEPFQLAPGGFLYSEIHYPNGPQCTSIGITPVNVAFTYQVSPNMGVAFTNSQTGDNKQTVQACSSVSDITQIEVWPLSTQPITP